MLCVWGARGLTDDESEGQGCDSLCVFVGGAVEGIGQIKYESEIKGIENEPKQKYKHDDKDTAMK